MKETPKEDLPISPELVAELTTIQTEALSEIGKNVNMTLKFVRAFINDGRPVAVMQWAMQIEGGRVLKQCELNLELGGTITVTGLQFVGGSVPWRKDKVR